MTNDYYKKSAEDTKVPKATTERANWLRKFNPRSYAIFNIICIVIIVFIFIIYWRYIHPKWYKKYIENYYNLKGSNTLILQIKKAELRRNIA